jgi:hypothetical protein
MSVKESHEVLSMQSVRSTAAVYRRHRGLVPTMPDSQMNQTSCHCCMAVCVLLFSCDRVGGIHITNAVLGIQSDENLVGRLVKS